jgi:DNA-binding GntR family transcriptional regulator
MEVNSVASLEDSLKMRKRDNIADIATNIIRGKILRGDVAPFKKIPIKKLCEELDVSFSSIKEALIHLTGEGLVVMIPRRGFRVRIYSVEEFSEIQEISFILESKGVELALKRIKNKDIKELYQLNEALDKLIQNPKADKFSIFEGELNFHLRLHRITNNSILLDTIHRFWLRSASLSIVIYNLKNVRQYMASEHIKIIKGMENRDLEESIAALNYHRIVGKETNRQYKEQVESLELKAKKK